MCIILRLFTLRLFSITLKDQTDTNNIVNQFLMQIDANITNCKSILLYMFHPVLHQHFQSASNDLYTLLAGR